MKYKPWISMLVILAIGVLMTLFYPTVEESHLEKANELVHRNALEKQLVGKWNWSQMPEKYRKYSYYHLLDADLVYRYRGSDNSKVKVGQWSINTEDSILRFGRSPNFSRYKIETVRPDTITFSIIKNDSLSKKEVWIRHPEVPRLTE